MSGGSAGAAHRTPDDPNYGKRTQPEVAPPLLPSGAPCSAPVPSLSPPQWAFVSFMADAAMEEEKIYLEFADEFYNAGRQTFESRRDGFCDRIEAAARVDCITKLHVDELITESRRQHEKLWKALETAQAQRWCLFESVRLAQIQDFTASQAFPLLFPPLLSAFNPPDPAAGSTR